MEYQIIFNGSLTALTLRHDFAGTLLELELLELPNWHDSHDPVN
jgi:hypothetical protein